MNRRALILGLLATPALARAPKRIAVIGAGAAGLTAAHRLHKAGHDVRLFEARATWGGRMGELTGFADFPVDTGAEWIHGSPRLLDKIAGRGNLGIRTIDYSPETYQTWYKGRLKDLPAQDYSEAKFYRSTWVSFFRDFIVAPIADRITLNAPVSGIDGDSVILQDGRRFDADQVLVTVPLSVLQRGDLQLPRRLPGDLQDVPFGQGFKVMMKFSDRFYPDILIDGTLQEFMADSWEESIYFDAAFGKNARDNVLTLFSTRPDSMPRAALSKRALLAEVIAELDQIYDGAASDSLQDAFVQNWSQEPHIWGTYSMENETGREIADMLRPMSGRIFFAGEAMGGADQATVHGAAFSGLRAAKQMG